MREKLTCLFCRSKIVRRTTIPLKSPEYRSLFEQIMEVKKA